MEYDLKNNKLIMSIQNQHISKDDFVQPNEEDLLTSLDIIDDQQTSCTSKSASNRVELTQELSIWERLGLLRRQRISPNAWRLIAIAGDAALLVGLLAIVLILAPHSNPALLSSWYKPEVWHPKLILACLALVAWSGAARITQAHVLGNISGRLTSPLCALFALVLMLIFLMILTFPFIINEIAYAKGLALYLFLAAPILCIWRVILADVMNSPRFRPRAVVIGANSAGESVTKELCSAKRYTANVLGYISANPEEREQKVELPILGGSATLRDLVQNGMIDMIIMAINFKDDPDLFQEAIELAQPGIAVVPVTMAYERTSGKIPVEHIRDQWYVSLPSEIIISPLYLCWRKFLDITFGLIGTMIMLLLLPVLGAMIYLDSPGPIFYKQERLGCNRRKFTIYKFRSMRRDAENAGHAQWAADDDLRITRIGHFMRATHLDELPQVLNILRGDMSLIGPRPERQEFVSILEKSIPFYRFRLSVKPGLTGWAQVKYGYGRTDNDALEKLQYDLYYIKNPSFMLDIFILIRTIAEVLLHRGA